MGYFCVHISGCFEHDLLIALYHTKQF